jgi:hypothetical protein
MQEQEPFNVKRYIVVISNVPPEYENVREIPLNISAEEIRSIGIVPADEGDIYYYVPNFDLTKEQLEKLAPFHTEELIPDFDNYSYALGCEQA